MNAFVVIWYVFVIIWGFSWPPLGWLFSFGVIVYLIYEFNKANSTKIKTKAPKKNSIVDKGKMVGNVGRSVKISTSNPIKSYKDADEIKKYAELKDRGIITEEEFNAKKKQILGL